MLSNHLILCCPLLLLSIFPSIRGFPSESIFPSGGQSIGASASTSVLPMNNSRLISFRMDWLHSLLGCHAIKSFSFSKKKNCPKWYLGFRVQWATSPPALLHKHIWIHDFFFFWLCHAACGILVPWPGIEPTAPRLGTQRPNYRTSKEVPESICLRPDLGPSSRCCCLVTSGPPGSSVYRILQARILEWVAMPSSRGSSWPRDWTWVSYIAGKFFTAEPPGKPTVLLFFSKKSQNSLEADSKICQDIQKGGASLQHLADL